jgi:hypothetical protein
MQTQNTMKNTTSTSTSTTTTTTTTTAANTNLQTAFAKELATHGIVRVEFGTADAFWGHVDVTTLDEARAAAREFFANEENRRYSDSTWLHYPETVGLRVYPTAFEELDAASTTPDWGIAYCRGECLGWVGLRGQPGDDFLDGHYASQGEAEEAMNAALEMV